ncbi:hypothetical protein F4814DRAFT_398424 [Daldinia grandis]|nr:hypothetical protein F4814DRAFT_398424 [Daldinia grandis]
MIVLEATQELNDLLQGPRNLFFNHEHNQLLYPKSIHRFDIVNRIPVGGETAYEDLAVTIGLDCLFGGAMSFFTAGPKYSLHHLIITLLRTVVDISGHSST